MTEANFTIGEARTAVVGEQLVRVKDFRRVDIVTPMVRPTEAATLSFQAARMAIPTTIPVPVLKGVDGSRYALVGSNALKIDPDGVFEGQVLQRNGPGTYADTGTIATLEPVEVRFAPHDQVRSSTVAEGENYEIVFTGRDASSIRFQYREYTDEDMARTAFSQDLTYPVDAKTIRFRNLTIAIDQVGSDSVTYRVIERRQAAAD